MKKIPGTNKFVITTVEATNSEPLLIQFKSNDNACSFGVSVFLLFNFYVLQTGNFIKHMTIYVLSFIRKDTAHYVTLIDKILFLEVQVTSKSDNSNPEVFDSITKALHKIGSALNIKLKYGLWCKECKNPEEMYLY